MPAGLLMTLGGYVFSVDSAAQDEIRRVAIYRWEMQDRIGRPTLRRLCPRCALAHGPGPSVRRQPRRVLFLPRPRTDPTNSISRSLALVVAQLIGARSGFRGHEPSLPVARIATGARARVLRLSATKEPTIKAPRFRA